MVSNRLPITIKKKDSGNYNYSMSSGGLVSGLSGMTKTTTFSWFGWPGLELPEGDIKKVEEELKEKYNAVPIWLPDEMADRHCEEFSLRPCCCGKEREKEREKERGGRKKALTGNPLDNGFSSKGQIGLRCNIPPRDGELTLGGGGDGGCTDSILWPLFHYHPGEISFDESAWIAYHDANRIFAKEVAKQVKDNDLVWVHDYHLMLMPGMLREELGDRAENVKVGFFLHTPFPSSEIYRILPVREKILQGVLHCDLLGFHTFDYARHFLSCCARIL